MLLESLNKTKASSMTIAESLQDAHRIQTTLDQVSTNYFLLLDILQGLCHLFLKSHKTHKWSRGGAVVRALASHQCGPGSIPGPDVECGLSLLLVLVLAPRGFSPGTLVFPSPQKPTFPNANSILEVSPIRILC